MSKTPRPKRRWRWLQFRLRTLLLLTVIAAALAGWIAKERRQSVWEQQLADELRAAGANVSLAGPFDAYRGKKGRWWQNAARKLFGERILQVSCGGPHPHSLGLRPKKAPDLARLNGLSNLRSLWVQHTPLRDLTQVAQFEKLESLMLDNTDVSDISALRGLVKLQQLSLEGTRVRDLAPLAGLLELDMLNLQGTPASDLSPLAGLSKLKALALPDESPQGLEWMEKTLPGCSVLLVH